jgi:hypothetical protein
VSDAKGGDGQVGTVTAPVNASEALEMVRAGMGFLAAADATAMPAAVQAQCLQGLEEIDSVETVARASVLRASVLRASVLRAFSARDTAATGSTARRPAEHRDEADAILIAAVAGGATLEDLLALGEKMYEMSRSGTPDGYGDSGDSSDGAVVGSAGEDGAEGRGAGEGSSAGGGDGEGGGAGDGGVSDDGSIGGDQDQVFDDRSVRLVKTMDGAGVLVGDLTPECAAAVGMVLDALSGRVGAEDTRTQGQRCHDALEEAMRRLAAADMVPARAGQPAKVVAHIALLDLIQLDAGSALATEWTARVRAQWAAARAAAPETGGDGGVWLDGEAAQGFACDAGITPVVVGDVNLAALEALVRLCQELGGHGPGRCQPCRSSDEGSSVGAEDRTATEDRTGAGGPQASGDRAGGRRGSGPVPPTERGRAALERAIIGKAVDLLSGPGGLASFLRRGLLGARLGGPSLPLDVGWSENIPAAIRNAVLIRDRHCRWPGGCSQPASACHVHHVRHKARGGKTSVKDCVLLCAFHHLVAIHRWGWTLALNGDGTTTAWNKDHTRVLHSHAPPTTRAG